MGWTSFSNKPQGIILAKASETQNSIEKSWAGENRKIEKVA